MNTNNPEHDSKISTWHTALMQPHLTFQKTEHSTHTHTLSLSLSRGEVETNLAPLPPFISTPPPSPSTPSAHPLNHTKQPELRSDSPSHKLQPCSENQPYIPRRQSNSPRLVVVEGCMCVGGWVRYALVLKDGGVWEGWV